jgi:hypothetical protein
LYWQHGNRSPSSQACNIHKPFKQADGLAKSIHNTI